MKFKIIKKWFMVTFLNECKKCNRQLHYKWKGHLFTYKCKCGNEGSGHNYSNFGER